MRNDLMSSEESDTNENGEEIVIVHPPEWRSSYCSKMFSKIDQYIAQKLKTAQGRRQMKKRKVGCPSTRGLPDEKLPDWSIIPQ